MSLKAKLQPYIFALGLIFSLFSFNNVFAFDLNGCTPLQNPSVNFCQNQTWYSGVDFKLTPTGTLLTATIHQDGRVYLDECVNIPQTLNSYFSMLATNPSTAQSFLEQDNGQFGLCDYGLAVSSTYGGVGDYFYELYSGSGWGNRVAYGYVLLHYDGSVWTTGQPLVDGTCGTDNNQNVTAEPTGTGACATGTITDMLLSSNYLSSFYSWFCDGSGGGTMELCYAPMIATVNGTCGTADGNTSQYAPTEQTMCATGFSGNSLSTTVNGWTWSCYGNNNGTIDNCSQTDSGAITLPTNPIEDCDTYTGIDKIVCNLGNTIQGMFLPSQSKLEELQTTINKVGNVFPFNYLRIIGTTFSNSTVTNGGLTMTLLGNTASLDSSFFTIPLFAKVKLFFTIMVLLMFTFWAINYIKHFFK